MKIKLAIYLKRIFEFLSLSLAIIAFIFNDYKKLKELTIMQYIIDHWNWLAIAIIFAIWIKLFRIVIKEDVKEVHKDIINSSQELQKIFMPDLSMNNIFIREVLMKSMSEESLYELLETAVFEEKKFNIPALEKFGIEKRIINKLKAKYHEIEAEKLS